MNDVYISDNFKLKEFESTDNNLVKVDKKLVEKLELLRKKVNEYLNTDDTPIIITSAFRTWKHHKRIYIEYFGSEWKEHITDESLHLKGKATDLRNPHELTPKKFKELAEEVGFSGIGLYSWGIHVDVADRHARWDNR